MRAKHAVRLVSTGAYLPGEPITNEDLERLVGPLPADVLRGLGVLQRHWIVDPLTGEHRDSNTAMAYGAVLQALERAEMEAGEVDLLISCTASPEYLLPPMVTFLQERLGLTRCAVLELRSGCAGTVEALDIAAQYLASGRFRTAVVVGSEAVSPLLVPVFLGQRPERIRMRNRMNPYGFGDGAGAIVLRADEEGGSEGLLGGSFECVGGDRAPGMQIVGAGTHAPVHVQLEHRPFVELKVDVVESGRFTPYVMTEAVDRTLAATDLTHDDIDICIIPEGNAGYVLTELEEAGLLTPQWAAFQPKIFENLALVGATGSAAVPLALDHAWQTVAVQTGDRVLLLAIETSKWKYAGSVLNWTAAPLSEGQGEAAVADVAGV